MVNSRTSLIVRLYNVLSLLSSFVFSPSKVSQLSSIIYQLPHHILLHQFFPLCCHNLKFSSCPSKFCTAYSAKSRHVLFLFCVCSGLTSCTHHHYYHSHNLSSCRLSQNCPISLSISFHNFKPLQSHQMYVDYYHTLVVFYRKLQMETSLSPYPLTGSRPWWPLQCIMPKAIPSLPLQNRNHSTLP